MTPIDVMNELSTHIAIQDLAGKAKGQSVELKKLKIGYSVKYRHDSRRVFTWEFTQNQASAVNVN